MTIRSTSHIHATVPLDSTTQPVVFVVDDDVSVRESLEPLISSAGWRCETFASAAQFLARPRVAVPSCLVLDVNLPDLNGLDLQARHRTTGILVTHNPEIAERCTRIQRLDGGVLHPYSKPDS